MSALRRLKNPLLACCFVLFVVVSAVYRFTNIFGVVVFEATRDPCFNSSCISFLPSTVKSNIELDELTNELPISLHCNEGRLGNQMCTYATLVGLSALNNRRFIPLSCNIKHLKDIFVGPSRVQSVDESMYTKLHPWNLTSYLRSEDAAVPRNSNFLEGFKYPCSYTFFEHIREKIRQEFQFKEHLVQYAQNILRKANVQSKKNVTYVSIHVRRGDYMKRWLEVFEGVPVNMEYFQKAVQYFRDKYSNVIFIGVSDDRLWCTRHLSSQFGVYVPEDAPSPAHDLALLANCNHSIMSYGTFGFWGAYLAGGDVVYFDKFLKPNTSFTLERFIFEKMYLPRWKGIVTVEISEIFPENNRTVKNESTTSI